MCGAAVVLAGFAPNLNGTLTIVGQVAGGNGAGPDTRSSASRQVSSSADALTGGTLTARAGGPMLLSGKEALPASVDAYLVTVAETVHTAVLFGGTGALSMAVEDAVRARVIR